MKQKITRLLGLALGFTMLASGMLGAMVACNNDPKDPSDDDPTSMWTLDESVAYTVIRSEYAAKDVVLAAATLRTALQNATGIDVGIDTDYVDRGAEVPSNLPEILVGETNRPACQELLATLSPNEYIIQLTDDHQLLILGYDDDCTVAAVEYFISTVLGYQEATDDYAVKKLELKTDYRYNGTYTAPAVVPPSTPSYETIYEEQNKPTTSPATYVCPFYKLENGLYVQSYESFDLQGVRTTFQANDMYVDSHAVNADSVMVYSTSGKNFASWYGSEDYVVDMMIAINRANSSYLSLDKSNYDDIQKDASGNYIEHSTGGSYYMVPSMDWIEYVWSEMLLPMIEQYHPQTIALEEPEMWVRSGYSETFKQEWKEFYGEEWQAPNSSAAANLKANLLKTYLFERILTVLCERVEEVSPSTQIYIASHSTVNYAAWSITAGLNSYLALDCLDGVIGQTWSDTHNSVFPYNGSTKTDNFTNAFLEYASYVDSVEGTNFYALADPMMDNTSRTEEGCVYYYRQSIAAQLMQPEINRFQILPWVQRAYGNVSSAYRTIQSQIFAMLNDIGGQEITMTAGTPGISYLASDSMSWMNSGSGWANNPTDGMYGLCAPLVRDGVPVKMKAMEQIESKDDLDGVTLLVASYDSSVPLSEEVNTAIADWVKAGGTLLYVSGYNQYWDIDNYFFWANDVTPLANLLRHLGLTQITVNTGSANGLKTSARFTSSANGISDIFNGQSLTSSYISTAITFTGAKNPILKLGNQVIGFEESVGHGNVVVFGIPSAYLANYKGGSSMLRTMVDYALQYTDYEYVSSEMMVTHRGKYVIAHAFDTAQTLKGTYINLYDENLSVLVDPVVPKEDSMILVDVSAYDLSIPRLGFCSGELDETSLQESATKTVYSFTSATNTIIANRLLAPAGTYPQSIQVTDQDGNNVTVLSTVWDQKTNSLRFTIDGSRTPLTVTVTWGSKSNALEISSFTYQEVNIPTNSKGNDEKYLIKNTAAANDNLRYCDNIGELVYQFDITEYDSPLYQLYIAQNYIVEVSGDGKTWTMFADFSEGGKVEHIKDDSNSTTLNIDPSKYEAVTQSGTLYIRLRNSNVSMGWGASLTKIVIRHRVKTDGIASESGDWMLGKNNTSNMDDDAISTPMSTADEETKYLIKTENGTSTYKRKVYTNQNNQDADFLVLNTAAATDSYRYCDTDRQLVYYFDISEMKLCELTFRVLQNYIVEVSRDNKTWEIVADYSEGGTKEHLTSGGNDTNVVIDPFDYDCDTTGDCYVRIRNTDIGKGWGGTVRYFEMYYTKAAK